MLVKDKTIDYLFWDIGVTSNHNDNWGDNGNKGIRVRDESGTTLSAQTGKTWVQFFAQSTATFFTNPFTVEFEVVSYINTPAIRFTDNSANKVHQVSTGIWKITIGTNSITVLKDGQLQSHYLSGLEGKDCKVFFELSENEDVIKYNNFRIYSI